MMKKTTFLFRIRITLDNGKVRVGNQKYPWFDDKGCKTDELLSTK